ncbi:unnamed protein product, partial [Lymnaea stagnalis]
NNDNSELEVYSVTFKNSETKNAIRKIQISSASSTTVLSLCEVEAYGECPPRKWGLQCKDSCPAECTDTCDKDTGSCRYCYGYRNPPYCTTGCTSGKYGRNCAISCPANCDYSGCDPFTGNCKMCNSGYQGDFCENGTTFYLYFYI